MNKLRNLVTIAILLASAPLCLCGESATTNTLATTEPSASAHGVFAFESGVQYSKRNIFGGPEDGGDTSIFFGVSYYFTEYVGIGADFSTLMPADHPKGGKSLFTDTTANLLLRYPLGRISPYVLAGGGRNWHEGEYLWQAGGGLDLRLKDGVSLFAEVRYVKVHNEQEILPARLGLRFAKW